MLARGVLVHATSPTTATAGWDSARVGGRTSSPHGVPTFQPQSTLADGLEADRKKRDMPAPAALPSSELSPPPMACWETERGRRSFPSGAAVFFFDAARSGSWERRGFMENATDAGTEGAAAFLRASRRLAGLLRGCIELLLTLQRKQGTGVCRARPFRLCCTEVRVAGPASRGTGSST